MVCYSLFLEQRHGEAVLNFNQAEKQTVPLYTETAGQRHQEAWSQEAPGALHVWALNRPQQGLERIKEAIALSPMGCVHLSLTVHETDRHRRPLAGPQMK